MRRCAFGSVVVVAALIACHAERGEAPSPVVTAVVPAPANEAGVEEPVAPPAPGTDSMAALEAQPPASPVPVETPDTTAPSAPASLVARAVSPSEVSLSWETATDDVGVSHYEVIRGGLAHARARSGTAVDRSVRPGREYCYAVVALDEAGNRSPPSRLACTSLPDVAPPTIPGDLAVNATSDRVVAISWSASTDDGDVAAYEVRRGDVRVAVTTALQASEGELAPAGRYCYVVEAVDRAGNRSPRSTPVCATTPDLTPPSTPTTVVAHPWGEHEISVGWNPAHDDVGIAGYELLRDGKVVAKATETNAVERGLEPWREYCYQVRAYDAAGNMSPPTKPACTRTHDLTPPTAPVALATPTSDREIAIRWSASVDNVGVAAYEVERDGAIVARSGALEVSQQGLHPGRTYCFRVRATDPAGNESERTQACATTPDLSPPSIPARLAVAPRSATQVVAAWDDSEDDVGVVAYEIVRAEEVVKSVARTWTIVSNLGAEQEHCFAVRAKDRAGNRSAVAGPLCVKTPDRATPTAPVNLRVETGTTGVQLRWEPSPQLGVVYAVYEDDDRRVGMTSAETYLFKGSLFGEGRCYRVAAVDGAGRESPKTIPACAAAGVAVTVR